MHIDILIFAIIAAFLVYRLNMALGTKNGNERQRPNPFAPQDVSKHTPRSITAKPEDSEALTQSISPSDLKDTIDENANINGQIERGLIDIATADASFEVTSFVKGARSAFEMIVMAYSSGDIETLKSLLSPQLYADFKAGIKERTEAGNTDETIIHRIKAARIIEAHLGGTMAYITIDYDVEETTVTRDKSGSIVAGDPDHIFSINDIWTFTRDTRAENPDWVLIETRTPEK